MTSPKREPYKKIEDKLLNPIKSNGNQPLQHL